MPKKFGANEKKKQSKKQKHKEKYKEEQNQKKQKEEQEYWKETNKNIIKKKQRAEEKKQKALEKQAKQLEKKQLYQKEQKALEKVSGKDKDTKQLIKKLKEEAQELKIKKDKELQEKYRPKNDVVPYNNKIGEDLDKEFEKFYKLERPLEEDEIIAFSEIQALEQINQGVDKHPERRIKAAFNKFMDENMHLVQKEQPGLRSQQYRNILWKQFKKSDQNPMNKANNFDWSAKNNKNDEN